MKTEIFMKNKRKNKKNNHLMIVGLAAAGTAVICIVFAILFSNPSLDKLPEDYSVEDAQKDGYVVYENIDISYGQEKWDKFLKSVDSGKSCSVRLVFSSTNAKLKICDLSFDGKEYTLEFMEDGKLVSESYRYLLKSEKEPIGESKIDRRIIYFLADEQDLTWEKACEPRPDGTYAYRHFRVYCNTIYKSSEN